MSVLLKDSINCLPEFVAEQEVEKLDDTVVLADKYVLTHNRLSDGCWPSYQGRVNFPRGTNNLVVWIMLHSPFPFVSSSHPPASKAEVTCLYCKKACQKMSQSPAFIKKGNNPKPSGLITSGGTGAFLWHAKECEDRSDADYTPFITNGFVSLSCQSPVSVPVRIVQDTGAVQ